MRGRGGALRIILELAPYVISAGDNSFEAFIGLLHDAGYGLRRAPGGAQLPPDSAALANTIADGASINAWAMRT